MWSIASVKIQNESKIHAEKDCHVLKIITCYIIQSITTPMILSRLISVVNLCNSLEQPSSNLSRNPQNNPHMSPLIPRKGIQGDFQWRYQGNSRGGTVRFPYGNTQRGIFVGSPWVPLLVTLFRIPLSTILNISSR